MISCYLISTEDEPPVHELYEAGNFGTKMFQEQADLGELSPE